MLKFLVAILLTFLNLSVSFAESDGQLWNRIYKEYSKDDLEFGLQLQLRYSDEQTNLYEEQINASIHHKYQDVYKSYMGVIFTAGFSGQFSELAEKRFAIQYGMRPLSFYQFRFRYEMRNFSDEESLANRFRVLNGLDSKKVLFLDFTPFITSELNFYMNEFGQTQAGISSHRTIVGVIGSLFKNRISISYINDIKFISEENFTRHVLELAYSF